jgi:hypothetical protein
MIPDRVRAYREQQEISEHYHGWLHLAFTSFSSLVVIGWALSRVSEPNWKQFLIVPFTFFYANLVEYWGHRGPMHNPFRFMGIIYLRHAGQHHSYFTRDAMEAKSSREFAQVLFPPVMIVFFIGLFAVPVAYGLGRWLAPNIGFLFLATGVAYFLNYEWFHFAYHMPSGSWARRLPGMDSLLKLHTSHHNQQLMARKNFNITYPIGDWFFGTLHRG